MTKEVYLSDIIEESLKQKFSHIQSINRKGWITNWGKTIEYDEKREDYCNGDRIFKLSIIDYNYQNLEAGEIWLLIYKSDATPNEIKYSIYDENSIDNLFNKIHELLNAFI